MGSQQWAKARPSIEHSQMLTSWGCVARDSHVYFEFHKVQEAFCATINKAVFLKIIFWRGSKEELLQVATIQKRLNVASEKSPL